MLKLLKAICFFLGFRHARAAVARMWPAWYYLTWRHAKKTHLSGGGARGAGILHQVGVEEAQSEDGTACVDADQRLHARRLG